MVQVQVQVQVSRIKCEGACSIMVLSGLYGMQQGHTGSSLGTE